MLLLQVDRGFSELTRFQHDFDLTILAPRADGQRLTFLERIHRDAKFFIGRPEFPGTVAQIDIEALSGRVGADQHSRLALLPTIESNAWVRSLANVQGKCFRLARWFIGDPNNVAAHGKGQWLHGEWSDVSDALTVYEDEGSFVSASKGDQAGLS